MVGVLLVSSFKTGRKGLFLKKVHPRKVGTALWVRDHVQALGLGNKLQAGRESFFLGVSWYYGTCAMRMVAKSYAT